VPFPGDHVLAYFGLLRGALERREGEGLVRPSGQIGQ